MNDMHGQTVLITGGTSGIGLVTARELAWLGARVVIVGRNIEKTRRVVEEIKRATNDADVQYLIADLASLPDVRQLAAGFRKRYDRLNVLVNNAGTISYSRQITGEGHELTFAVNYLAPFLLTNLLRDMLEQSTHAQRLSRIIHVSSAAHRGARLNFDDLQSEKKYTALGAYGRSKLALTMFSYELARRLRQAGAPVTSNALHPGFVASGFGAQKTGVLSVASRAALALLRPFAVSSEKGAKTSIYLAASADVEGVSGKYFIREAEAASSAASMEESRWGELWERTTALVSSTSET